MILQVPPTQRSPPGTFQFVGDLESQLLKLHECDDDDRSPKGYSPEVMPLVPFTRVGEAMDFVLVKMSKLVVITIS